MVATTPVTPKTLPTKPVAPSRPGPPKKPGINFSRPPQTKISPIPILINVYFS